jgi:hypothetical protein
MRAANERKCRLSAEVHSSKRRVDTLRTHCIFARFGGSKWFASFLLSYLVLFI